ncbi:class I SAM-dependent methyltransferase [Pseudoduganella plicata]|nr:class I SAM-dependent methyltransferase [Pseudoduganella plicata]QBQ35934.1 class I SAM-dependent methyltransferase [Pseudoduganella plicata]
MKPDTASASPRFAPLLTRHGREETLPYAPPPWQLKRCLETDIVFLANPPAYGQYSEQFAYEVTFAGESAARRRAEPMRYAISTGLKRFRANVLKRNKTLRIVRALLAGSARGQVNVLDVGCGWGSLLDELGRTLAPADRARYVPHGIEISRELARISDAKLRPLGGRCVHAPALDGLAQFGGGCFDIVVMASYLEHELNPVPVLRQARAQLSEAGSIVVKVPNFDCWNRTLRGARWCGFRWPDHVNYFTPATLRRTVAAAGLHVVRFDANPLSDNMYAVLAADPVGPLYSSTRKNSQAVDL